MRLHRLAELVSKSCGHADVSITLQPDQISSPPSDRSIKLCYIVGLVALKFNGTAYYSAYYANLCGSCYVSPELLRARVDRQPGRLAAEELRWVEDAPRQ